ncbi:hypothetical protein D3C76_1134680 [compost metagenome]
MQRQQPVALVLPGILHAGQLQNGGYEVHGMQHVAIDLAALDRLRVADDRRNLDTTLGDEALEVGERRRAHLRPLRPEGDVGALAAHVFRAVVEGLVDPVLDPVAVLGGAQGFGGGRLRPVVGHEQDEGVVEFAGLAQMLDHTTDVVVQVVDHGRVDLHRPGLLHALRLGQLLPAGQLVLQRIVGLGARRQDAEFDHPRQALLPQRLIAISVGAGVLRQVLVRSL